MDPQSNPNILKYKIDRYHAATFHINDLPDDPNQFDAMMKETLEHFKEAKIRGVWLHLDIAKCKLIAVAAKHGFKYHHAKKQYVLMTHWIPQEGKNKLPNYASHFVGVGGVVINDETDEILLIQEKTTIVDNKWKVPGGLVDDNEYLSQAAEREVFEETGIKAEFQSLICFREKVDYKWKADDIYFVCLLKPLTFEIQACEYEIKAAKWMKIDEYLALDDILLNQKKIAEVVALRKYKGLEKLKSIDGDILHDVASLKGTAFEMRFGDRVSSNNVFYSPGVAKKLASSK